MIQGYTIPEKEIVACKKLLALFVLDGQKVSDIATPGQVIIFHAIVFKPMNRMEILCSTQYGKSLFIALGCIILSCVNAEVVSVIAPKDEKAKIIMRYYTDHLGDNPLFYTQLESNTRLERLRMEESRERIMLRNRGGIYIISAQTHNTARGIESAMGEGAKNVIQDESCLIQDIIESTIYRMIAGQKDAFYCKVGNPFYRTPPNSHFYFSYLDPKYGKVFIDYKQGLEEGRYTQEFIDEAKRKPNFGILFECFFPPENQVDDKGYTRLLTDEEIVKAIQADVQPFGEQRIAGDVAEGGGDYNAIVTRWANKAAVLLKYQTDDTMDMAAKIANFSRNAKVLDQNVFIDSIGVGKGVYDRLIEERWKCAEFKASEKADDDTQFTNKRAECFWRLRLWIKGGGKLDPHDDWWQLASIKTKPAIDGRLIVMSKEDMRKAGMHSPDVVDALAMTFSRKSVLNPKAKEERDLLRQFDSHKQREMRGPGYLTGARRL